MRDLRLTLILIAAGSIAAPVRADFDAGYRAFEAGNYKEALAQLMPLADQQDAAASYYVGLAYWDGRGVERNATTAVSYLRVAAYREHSGAQLMLAIAYEYGAGVPRDYRLAAQWMRSAAEKGGKPGAEKGGKPGAEKGAKPGAEKGDKPEKGQKGKGD